MESLKIVYSPKYEVDIGPHVFPTLKFRLIKEKLVNSKIIDESQIVEPEMVSDEDILLVHTKQWVEKIKYGKVTYFDEMRLELPYSNDLMVSSLICAQGTILACEHSLKQNVGIHIGGGFHHSYPDHGEGFCVFNDIAIGIMKLLKTQKIKRASVFDCDLHQGNGTAYIFRNIQEVFTFSIHQENNYPIPKEKSDLDIGLKDGTGDDEYLKQLQIHLPKIIQNHKPELIVYVAGSDPYMNDKLGKLRLTKEGFIERDKLIFELCSKNKIPVVIVLAGGYAQELEDTVDIHFNCIKTALNFFQKNIK